MSFRQTQKSSLFVNLSPSTGGSSASLQQDVLLTSLSNTLNGMGKSEAESRTTEA